MKKDNNSFDINEVTIREMLTDFFYEVSDFQRPYAWKKEQQSDLLNDIVDSLKKSKDGRYYKYQTEKFFLGNIILQCSDNHTRYIVDGQQRLITITILLALIRDELYTIYQNTHNSPESIAYAKELVPFIEKSLYKKKSGSFHPIINPLEEEDYLFGFILPSPENKIKDTRSENYEKGYTLLQSELQYHINEGHKSAYQRVILLDAIYRQTINCTVITLTLQDENTAYKVYSNINSKGMHLTAIDLIKNDFLYKTKEINHVPGLKKNLELWQKINDNVRHNTSITFDDFFKYCWFIIFPEDIFEYFDEDTNLFDIFQSKFHLRRSSSDILKFFKTMKRLSKYIDDFNKPSSIQEWQRDKWPIQVDKLNYLSNLQKDNVTNKYLLWLLPLYFRYKESGDMTYLKQLQKRIDFVADVLFSYNQVKRLVEKSMLQKFDSFFDEIFKEAACFGITSIEDKIILNDLKLEFSSIIENKGLLVKQIAALSYSKKHNTDDFHHIRFLLKRLNESRGNHLIDHRGSIEHIIEDSDSSIDSSKIGNLVYLETFLNAEAAKAKDTTTSATDLLEKKFQEIYPKSHFPEVQDLIEGIHFSNFDKKFVQKRSTKIAEKYIKQSFEP